MQTQKRTKKFKKQRFSKLKCEVREIDNESQNESDDYSGPERVKKQLLKQLNSYAEKKFKDKYTKTK